jgi:uncharacterized protein (DUF1330 family)
MTSLTPTPVYVVSDIAPTSHTAGWLRLRLPQWKGQGDKLQNLGTELRQQNSQVLEVRLYPTTGSLVIVHYQEKKQILDFFFRSQEYQLLENSQAIRQTTHKSQTKLNDKEKAAIKFLLFGGLTLFQASRGRALSAASSLMERAGSAWKELHKESSL